MHPSTTWRLWTLMNFVCAQFLKLSWPSLSWSRTSCVLVSTQVVKSDTAHPPKMKKPCSTCYVWLECPGAQLHLSYWADWFDKLRLVWTLQMCDTCLTDVWLSIIFLDFAFYWVSRITSEKQVFFFIHLKSKDIFGHLNKKKIPNRWRVGHICTVSSIHLWWAQWFF